MGIWRFGTISRNARTLACVGNRLSSPKARHCDDRAWSPPRGDDPDRPRPLHDDPFALSISAPHPVAARLVVGPDDVRDVGVGNERHDTVAPSGNGVGSEVDGGHFKSSPVARGFVSGRASPGPLREPLCCAFGAPAPDKAVRPTLSSEKLESLTTDAIAHRDETDHRIVRQFGGRALHGGCVFTQVVRPTEPQAVTSPGPSV